jgi:histidinol-phosphate aminotransferase
LAAARIGIAYANETIISVLQKVKPPYNISQLNQEAAVKALADEAQFQNTVKVIKSEREKLKKALQQLDFVTQVYPSEANFLLVEMENATAIYEQLIEQQIITRNRSSVVKDTVRITIGTPQENQQLLYALQLVTI